MPTWHPRSFDNLQPEDVVEFYEHGEDPNENASLTARWEGPVEVKTASDDGGKTVTVGTEHYVVRSREYEAWVRQGGYARDEIRLRRK